MCFKKWCRCRGVRIGIGFQRVNKENDLYFERILAGQNIMEGTTCGKTMTDTTTKLNYKLCFAQNHAERIKVIERIYPEANLKKSLTRLDNLLEKDEVVAAKFKQRGCVLYEAKKYLAAVRCCNLALLFAPPDSPSIGMIYGDRAVFLYALKDYDAVVGDVDVALKLLDSSAANLKSELAKLQEKSYAYIKNSKKSEDDKIVEARNKAFCEKVLFAVDEEANSKIPAAAKSVAITYDGLKGRVVVAARDIPAGTTVVVEDPYASLLTATSSWELKFCSKCFKKTHALIPCEGCVFTAYCSEKCRLDDYECHKLDCPCMNYFHAHQTPTSLQLAYKAVAKAGPEYMYDLFKHVESISEDTETKSTFLNGVDPRTGLYSSDSYYQIYKLISHFEGRRLNVHTWYGYTMAKLLELRTDFFAFAGIEEGQKAEFFRFIAAAFLHHAVSIPYNVMCLWRSEQEKKKSRRSRKGFRNRKDDKPTKVVRKQNEETPAGLNAVYSLTSLLNHSCNPSIIRVCMRNGKLALIANRRIKVGEELTISYGYEFSRHELESRRIPLLEKYSVRCDCSACTWDWPIEDKLRRKNVHICPVCTREYSYTTLCKFNQCVITVTKGCEEGICRNCRRRHDLPDLEKDLFTYQQLLKAASSRLKDGKTLEALPLLLECIEFFQSRLRSPSAQLTYSQNALTLAYSKIVPFN